MSIEEIIEETATHRVLIVLDEGGGEHSNPRDYENFGVMWVNHRDYTLGDHKRPEFAELGSFISDIKDYMPSAAALNAAIVKHLTRAHGATVVLPLYLYDHSGISISAGADLVRGASTNPRTHNPFDPGGWDTSFVGFIFDTARTREECGTPLDKVREYLDGEVKAYASYLEGDVWGFRIEERVIHHTVVTTTRSDGKVEHDERDTTEWEEVESCWGFLGHKYAVEEAKSEFSGYREVAA